MRKKKNRTRKIVTIIISIIILFQLAYLFQNCNGEKKEEETTTQETAETTEKVVLTDEDYVGTETCRSCHEPEYQDWVNSHHDLAMMEANEESVKGDFNNVTHTSQGVTSRFYKKDGDFYVTTEGPDGTMQEYKILYTFGIEPLQQYMVEFPGGRLQCLRTAWDTEENKWFDLYPNFKIDPSEWLHWTRGAMNWNTMCSDCHPASSSRRRG